MLTRSIPQHLKATCKGKLAETKFQQTTDIPTTSETQQPTQMHCEFCVEAWDLALAHGSPIFLKASYYFKLYKAGTGLSLHHARAHPEERNRKKLEVIKEHETCQNLKESELLAIIKTEAAILLEVSLAKQLGTFSQADVDREIIKRTGVLKTTESIRHYRNRREAWWDKKLNFYTQQLSSVKPPSPEPPTRPPPVPTPPPESESES